MSKQQRTRETILTSSWQRCWPAFTDGNNGLHLMEKLIGAYQQEHRHYHTLQHLVECLLLFQQYIYLAVHPAEIEIALWFHDAIYEPKAQDNELKSAEWAEAELIHAHVPIDQIHRIKALILATCHTNKPITQDQKLLTDIDLAILAAPHPRFLEYEVQVRCEYQWVPVEIFRQKRRELLRQLLARDSIYYTPPLQLMFEKSAKKNLLYSLQYLDNTIL